NSMRNSTYIFYGPQLPISLSVDPLTDQTMTPYQYTYQNPINLIDPTRMAAVDNDWDNPVYGSDGTYRGTTKEGFTGEILIYSGGGIQFRVNSNSVVNQALKL